MTIVQAVAYFMLLLAPLSVGGTIYLWVLHRRAKTSLSLFLVVLGTLSCLAALILALASFAYVIGDITLSQRLGPIVLLVFAYLDALPVVLAGFLRLIDGRG